MLKHVIDLTERIRFVNTVLPLLALWLRECPSVARIQGQDKLSTVRPYVGRVEVQRCRGGHL